MNTNLKLIAIDFLKGAAFGNIEKVFKEHVSTSFIHHNQYFEGTREALMEAMKEDHLKNPNTDFEVKFCYQDNNTIIVHSLVTKERMQIAVVHIAKFDQDKIVELWDLGQVISEETPNKNGLF